MVCRMADFQFLIGLSRAVDIDDLRYPGPRPPFLRSAFRLLPLRLTFGNQLQQILLTVISDHNIRSPIFLRLRSRRLHIAACRRHNSVRVLPPGPVDHLPGFPVCHIGDRTGIDHIEVRLFMKRHDLIPRLLQHLLHGLCLVRIHFTSQAVKRCSFHLCFIPFFLL